uniref:Reverse transcriptase zinc-binding domain-containing protein n=1 Tax=Chenopodium quinoa TaxID=63459 RepID=A0A803N1L4_CHEQI
MYVLKKFGGLGFRNMRNFNKALLAKQAWRILTNEDSLMSKVLKGKYFPKTYFMEAKASQNGSFTWRSILSSREVLEKGARKLIGDGYATRIWNDPWIPTLPGFKVIPKQVEEMNELNYVRDLWSDRKWNLQLLNERFLSWEVQEICNVMISLFDTKDVWTRNFSKDGRFDVKSAYNMLTLKRAREQASCSPSAAIFKWNLIWNASVPPKVKNFSWKAVREGLATRKNL